MWPKDVTTTVTKETEAEAKVIHNITLATTDITKTELVQVLKSYQDCSICETILMNARLRKQDLTSGPLTKTEIEESPLCSIKVIQEENANSDRFKIDQVMLNLGKTQQEIYICKGKIEGIYIFHRVRCLQKSW